MEYGTARISGRPRAHLHGEHFPAIPTFPVGATGQIISFYRGVTSVNIRVPGPLRGGFVLLVYTLNTLFWTILLFPVAFLKWLVPASSCVGFCNRLLHGMANNWISINNLNMRYLNRIRLEVEGVGSLNPEGWYLVVSNHQSWADILVLQKVFHRKIPLLKFFLKKELLWMPFLGVAWWALDFPFMKRYSKQYLEKHPEDAGKDLEITRRACEKFRSVPISVMNFVEGTRFTPGKHHQQGSPYVHLLKAKAGGIAMVIAAMGDKMRHILDVTIAYPGGNGSFWAFLCGDVTDVRVRVRSLMIGEDLIGDYFVDAAFRERFQQWLANLWAEKDKLLERMLDENRCSREES